ncbi:MAG: YsnF/AvaK domain-containing protein [Actinobacteria bacterium]|nr:YsnF/AvaK domain-containing protein [Actinomycetota bacterium]
MQSDDLDRQEVRGGDLGAPLEEPVEGLLIRQEEELEVGKRWTGVGYARAQKRVDTLSVDELVPRAVQDVRLERTSVSDGDSGRIEHLPDGAISIPVYEEQLVVTKRIVLKERVIVRKQVVSVQERVQDEIRKERVELDADEALRDRIHED